MARLKRDMKVYMLFEFVDTEKNFFLLLDIIASINGLRFWQRFIFWLFVILEILALGLKLDFVMTTDAILMHIFALRNGEFRGTKLFLCDIWQFGLFVR